MTAFCWLKQEVMLTMPSTASGWRHPLLGFLRLLRSMPPFAIPLQG